MLTLLAMIALLSTALWISVRTESRLASPPPGRGSAGFAAAGMTSASAGPPRPPGLRRSPPGRRCRSPWPVHPRHPGRTARRAGAGRRPGLALPKACERKPGTRSHPASGVGGKREARLAA